jgi:hypothetical protein
MNTELKRIWKELVSLSDAMYRPYSGRPEENLMAGDGDEVVTGHLQNTETFNTTPACPVHVHCSEHYKKNL